MSDTATVTRPRFGSIAAAVAYSARSRSRLYQLAEERPELFRKDNKSTLVDFAVLDAILDALPSGVGKPIKMNQRRKRRATAKEG